MKDYRIVLRGMAALLLVFGLALLGCSDDSGGGGTTPNTPDPGGSTTGGKSLTITGIDDYNEYDRLAYEVVLLSSLDDDDATAYSIGVVNAASITMDLIDFQTRRAWTGSGSYYVLIYFEEDSSTGRGWRTKNKVSFTSAVTTLSMGDLVRD